MATNFFEQCVTQKLKCSFTHRLLAWGRCNVARHGWWYRGRVFLPYRIRLTCGLLPLVVCRRTLWLFLFQGVWPGWCSRHLVVTPNQISSNPSSQWKDVARTAHPAHLWSVSNCLGNTFYVYHSSNKLTLRSLQFLSSDNSNAEYAASMELAARIYICSPLDRITWYSRNDCEFKLYFWFPPSCSAWCDNFLFLGVEWFALSQLLINRRPLVFRKVIQPTANSVDYEIMVINTFSGLLFCARIVWRFVGCVHALIWCSE